MYHPFIGAYWGPRKATLAECVAKTANYLKSLQGHGPPFDEWWTLSNVSPEECRRIEVTAENVLQLKIGERGLPPEALCESGFVFGAWNGNLETSISLDVSCGSFSEFVGNSTVIDLPEQAANPDSAQLDQLRAIISIVINIWDPDRAIVSTSEALAKSSGEKPWEAETWLSYTREGGIVVP